MSVRFSPLENSGREGRAKARPLSVEESVTRRHRALQKLKHLRQTRGKQVAAYAAGAAVGTALEMARPGTLLGVSENMARSAAEWGLPQTAHFFGTRIGELAGAAIRAAGLAGLAYDMAKTYNGTHSDVGSKMAQMGAVFLAGGITYLQGLGPVVLALELLSGGSVTGSVKGAVAVADAVLTGDRDTYEQWIRDTLAGDNGWTLQWLAQWEPLGSAVRALTEKWVSQATVAPPGGAPSALSIEQGVEASFESW